MYAFIASDIRHCAFVLLSGTFPSDAFKSDLRKGVELISVFRVKICCRPCLQATGALENVSPNCSLRGYMLLTFQPVNKDGSGIFGSPIPHNLCRFLE